MSLLDNDSFIERQNFFAHIYTTHAHRIINDYIARDKKERIRRARIERDIIRLTHENADLPVFHKVVCSSMIMHTDTFESFWAEAQLAYDLSAKSLKRLVPKYSLINGIMCPDDQEDEEEESSPTSPAFENVTSKEHSTNNDNDNAAAAAAAASSTSTKGNSNNKKKKSSTGRQIKPLQPQSANKKNAPKKPGRQASSTTTAVAATKTNTNTKTKTQTQTKTTGRPRGRPPAQSKPKTTSTTRAKPSGSGGGGVRKNVSARKDVTAAAALPAAITAAASSPPPRGPLSAREAYEECMARFQDEDKMRGPTSDEEETDDDDDMEL